MYFCFLVHEVSLFRYIAFEVGRLYIHTLGRYSIYACSVHALLACVDHGHRNAVIRSMHVIHACVDQGKVGKVDQGKRR